MANAAPEVFATTAADAAVVEQPQPGAPVHAEPSLLGLAPYQIVSIAMLLLLAIAFFGAKVHRKIGGGLDRQIAAIREQLDEAKALRAEAEGLRDEYAGRIARAEQDAEGMLTAAREEADAILTKAESDAAATIARRQRMAEDKISAAERQAIADVQSRAAHLATKASGALIAERHTADADRSLVDQAISAI